MVEEVQTIQLKGPVLELLRGTINQFNDPLKKLNRLEPLQISQQTIKLNR